MLIRSFIRWVMGISHFSMIFSRSYNFENYLESDLLTFLAVDLKLLIEFYLVAMENEFYFNH